MFNKLITLYSNAILSSSKPDNTNYHCLFDKEKKEWLGIPKDDISEKELLLLKTMFEYHEPIVKNKSSLDWYKFLFSDGGLPLAAKDIRYRIIQFSCEGNEWDKEEMIHTLKGFFSEEIIVLWENGQRGILIEKEKEPFLKEEEFYSISKVFESDFFLKISFFKGKFYTLEEGFKSNFHIEKNFFHYGLELIPKERVLTFERVFPYCIVAQMPSDLMEPLDKQVYQLFKDDSELLNTVKVFLENNSNASLTAKKLYIHRNTLQYRLDKFSEKTGVNLKEFQSGLSIYLACLLQPYYS